MNDLLSLVRTGSRLKSLGSNKWLRAEQPTSSCGRTNQQTIHQQAPSAHDIEAGRAACSMPDAAHEQSQELQQFFRSVEAIRSDLGELRKLRQQIQQMHDRGKVVIKTKERQKHREELQAIMDTVNVLAHQIKLKLEKLEHDNQVAIQMSGQGTGSTSERMRTSATAALRDKLKEIMVEFSSMQQRMRNEEREAVQRRVYMATGQQLPQEDIEHMIDKGQAETLFQQALMIDQASARARVLDTLAEVEERHKEMQALEKSLQELHQIFIGVLNLIEHQGQKLVHIEKQVDYSASFVQTGVVQLADAKEHQMNARRLKCYAAAGTVFSIIIIVLVLLLVFKPWL